MKLPLLDQIRLTQDRAVPPPSLNWANVTFEAKDPPMMADPYWLEYVAKIEVFFAQTAPQGSAPMIERRARRALAEFIYGPVEKEVRAAMRELWQEGRHGSKAEARLEAMLVVLRGDWQS